MDSIAKRLGVAMASVVLLLGANAVVVVSGVAEQSYAHLLDRLGSRQIAGPRSGALASTRYARAGECAQSPPKQVSPEQSVLVASLLPCRNVPARMC